MAGGGWGQCWLAGNLGATLEAQKNVTVFEMCLDEIPNAQTIRPLLVGERLWPYA